MIKVIQTIDKSKKFEKDICKFLNKNISEISIDGVGIVHGNGYGNYNFFLDFNIKVFGKELTFVPRIHTTDSEQYDYFTMLERGSTKHKNWCKQQVLKFLHSDIIIGFIDGEIELKSSLVEQDIIGYFAGCKIEDDNVREIVASYDREFQKLLSENKSTDKLIQEIIEQVFIYY